MSEPVTKSTAERVLDVAEALFAEKGYAATSLGDVADRVGIRSPSLYNHFKNKEALYSAVVDRLLEVFNQPLHELLQGGAPTEKLALAWQAKLVRLHIQNPNLARILQHAALSGGPQSSDLFERFFNPLLNSGNNLPADTASILLRNPKLFPWAVMAMMNLLISYVTMAPIYRQVLGIDPLTEEAIDMQVAFLNELTRAVWTFKGEPPEPAA